MKSVAGLIYLAEYFKNDYLLKQIEESLLRAAIKDMRALCYCYIIAFTCNLDLKEQDEMRYPCPKNLPSDIDLLVGLGNLSSVNTIMYKCDLATEDEKSLVFFVVDWTSLHKTTREECMKLLNCVRRTFISPEDMKALDSYVEKFGTRQMQLAWKDYLVDTHISVCWKTEHIVEKLPRCGLGKYRPPVSKPKRNHQGKSISWSVPLETRAPSEEGHPVRTIAKAARGSTNRKSLLARRPRATNLVKTAFNRGLSKIRQKFTANSQD
ncbi:hypothetical protein GCK32_014974 [Trichostrongylus colubriformis]|uniref:BACK domain-containing protein n=1 Tax=Trichostrongylus colubriformis TaxID=6319 RepID=A0AAN8FCG8_TRICO